DLGPDPVADRVPGEVVEPAAGDAAARVAAERVRPDEDRVSDEEQGAAPDAEAAALTLERQHRVVGQDQSDRDGGVEEPAVRVLEDQRELGLAAVGLVRL